MGRCKGVTKKGTRCSRILSGDSEYCHSHPKPENIVAGNNCKECKEILERLENAGKRSERNSKWSIICSFFGIIIALGGILISFIAIILGFLIAQHYFVEGVKSSVELSDKSFNDTIKLAEASLNETFLMTSPVVLSIDDTINETEGRWYINVTNTHPLKETGAIYLFKLEKNLYKPQMVVKEGLKPNESRLFSLTFKMTEQSVDFVKEKTPYGLGYVPPSTKAYYVTDDISISFRINCDNCPSTGFMRRLPGFSKIDFRTILYGTGEVDVKIPTYEWTDYHLEDILRNEIPNQSIR